MGLARKRVLITLPKVNKLGGATVVAIELATYLMSQDCKVVVYVSTYEYPARKYFEERNINVVAYDEEPDLRLVDFDYIFINSQILPLSIVKDLGKKQAKKNYPYFIFLHKSPFNYIPDEHPWIYDLEDRLADHILYVSEEVLQSNEILLDRSISYSYFRNPAPVYDSIIDDKVGELRSILIVSNHPPEEVLEAKALLEGAGVEVAYLGDRGGQSGLINYELLAPYDCVITIGKTVQYCLMMGKPVYIYDHFGGGGYLNNENFQHARKNNFSGRLTTKKSAKTISREIISGYSNAKSYMIEHVGDFKGEFSIDSVLNMLCKEIQKRPKVALDKKYIESVLCAQRLAVNYFKVLAERDYLLDTEKVLRQEVCDIYNSISWRVGHSLVKPVSAIRRKLNGIRLSQ